ncbi:hypothetical protein MAM1_0307c09496 [Mucor ambiguus]|uniref:TIL domain-containing protein n=1 Tax=Mucor ambiguus TaxID=91626 RepID=A0A0C9N5U5_9FUNG|nr:hypothetical protein MAM1_0307c09496 [Mucor ambiguus]
MQNYYILLLALICSIISVGQAGSFHRRSTEHLFEKREENCDISCPSNACAEICNNSNIDRNQVSDVRVVCQEGVCYCGFEVADDV